MKGDQEKLERLCNRKIAGEATAYCGKLLYKFAIEDNCKTILELGTGSGVSTKIFLLACKLTGGHVWTVDKRKARINHVHYGSNWGLNSMITCIKSDSLKYKWDKPLDLLFIDTDHTYELTLAELNKFSPFVKYGHKILLHDSLLDGVMMAGVEGGVLRAIKTFLKENPDYDFYETGVKCGLAVLTKHNNPIVEDE